MSEYIESNDDSTTAVAEPEVTIGPPADPIDPAEMDAMLDILRAEVHPALIAQRRRQERQLVDWQQRYRRSVQKLAGAETPDTVPEGDLDSIEFLRDSLKIDDSTHNADLSAERDRQQAERAATARLNEDRQLLADLSRRRREAVLAGMNREQIRRPLQSGYWRRIVDTAPGARFDSASIDFGIPSRGWKNQAAIGWARDGVAKPRDVIVADELRIDLLPFVEHFQKWSVVEDAPSIVQPLADAERERFQAELDQLPYCDLALAERGELLMRTFQLFGDHAVTGGHRQTILTRFDELLVRIHAELK